MVSLKIVPPNPSLGKQINEFFEEIKDNKFFHPHPFDLPEARKLCSCDSNDIYCLLIADSIIGYGFVRGFGKWPDVCLGIIIEPSEQGKGYGELLMNFLHASAKRRDAKRIRVHVHPDNKSALALYEKIGYFFNGQMKGREMIGICPLT